MPKLICSPTPVEAMGNMPKVCEEYAGLINTGDTKVSLTRMHSPGGWMGPAHHAEFHQYLLVISGALRVEHQDGIIEAKPGQCVHIVPGEGVVVSTPGPDGCEYLSVCVPAYSRSDVHLI